MNQTTIIDSPHANIASSDFNPSKNVLIFRNNKNIYFLPSDVYETFPNLIELDADKCSVFEIFKENFWNLRNLKILRLQENEIRTIPSDAFEDLKELESLLLGGRI